MFFPILVSRIESFPLFVESTQRIMQFKITSITQWCGKTVHFPLSDVYLSSLSDWVYGSLWLLCKEKEAWQRAVRLQCNLWPGVHGPGGSWSAGVYELLGPGSLPRRRQAEPLQAQTPHPGIGLLWLPHAARASRASKGLCVPLLPGKWLKTQR